MHACLMYVRATNCLDHLLELCACKKMQICLEKNQKNDYFMCTNLDQTATPRAPSVMYASKDSTAKRGAGAIAMPNRQRTKPSNLRDPLEVRVTYAVKFAFDPGTRKTQRETAKRIHSTSCPIGTK